MPLLHSHKHENPGIKQDAHLMASLLAGSRGQTCW
jgi:hypothetical protein